jgi:hypothetical protein
MEVRPALAINRRFFRAYRRFFRAYRRSARLTGLHVQHPTAGSFRLIETIRKSTPLAAAASCGQAPRRAANPHEGTDSGRGLSAHPLSARIDEDIWRCGRGHPLVEDIDLEGLAFRDA